MPGWLGPLAIAAVFSGAALLWVGFFAPRFRRPQSSPRTRYVVCIDPGHPTSYSPGRRVLNGVTELEINWEVALKLESLFADVPWIRTVRTRHDRDTLMNNAERAEVSNQSGASLFLRLHCDAGPNHGFTLYFPDRKGSDLGFTGPSDEVLLESRGAAYKMHAGMLALLRGYLKDRGVKGESRTKVGKMQGALTGSILSKAPVVTVEMVFLNNAYDASFIKSAAGQDRMARALAKGVIDYLKWKDRRTAKGSKVNG